MGVSLDALLAQLDAALDPAATSAEREAVQAAVNGVLGDHLAASANPLAIPMRLRRDGQPLDLTTPALAAALPQPTGKILVLAHGLCMNDRQWQRKGHDHGAALAADAGFTPVYLHYNSGLHVSTNGRAFAGQLEALLGAWPVPVDELVILGHSMGGLLARSACHYGELAGHAWPRHLRKIVFLGTPHHGTTFERGGNWVTVALGVSRYTAAFARLGKIRSAGITDLRYGSFLDEDWEDQDRFARDSDTRRILPLPDGVQCYAIGAAIPTGESVPERAASRRRTRAFAQRAWPAPRPGPEPAFSGVAAVDRLRHEPLGPARSERSVRADPRVAGRSVLTCATLRLMPEAVAALQADAAGQVATTPWTAGGLLRGEALCVTMAS